MIVVVCSAVIRQTNKTLFVFESKPSAAGKWGLPGGKLEEGESILDCLHREVREETGYTITSQVLLRVVSKPMTHECNTVVRFIFLCEVAPERQAAYGHKTEFLSEAQVHDLAAQNLIRGGEIPDVAFQINGGKPEDLISVITS